MYYYLVEQTVEWAQKKNQDKLKKLVGQYGIAGETVSPSPARTVDELVTIGLEKNYSTFVGVGSDAFLNRVASSLINQRGGVHGDRVVVGCIPVNFETDFARWLGIKTIEQAATMLKTRKIANIAVGLIEPSKYFIAPLVIAQKKPFSLKLITPQFELETQAERITIDTNLAVVIQGPPRRQDLFHKLRYFFVGGPLAQTNNSQLFASRIKIETIDTLPVQLGREIIAKTPISLTLAPNALQMIVEKAIM
ncbi:hypothetical protein HY065_02320 [Candidatus Berkelbacteria bacterium]|nr:hypothetical protein [Candidatus Berkelbacteria bacterium]